MERKEEQEETSRHRRGRRGMRGWRGRRGVSGRKARGETSPQKPDCPDFVLLSAKTRLKKALGLLVTAELKSQKINVSQCHGPTVMQIC